MPVDLSYLYSTSPPLQRTFIDHCSNSLRLGHPHGLGQELYCLESYKKTVMSSLQPRMNPPRPLTHTMRVVAPCSKDFQLGNPRMLQEKNDDGCMCCRSFDSDALLSNTKTCLRKPDPRNMPGITKTKKVTFADTHGLTLTFVKYMSETTQEPPKWDLLDSMVKNLKLSAKPRPPEPSIATEKPKLVANFKQPVANYLEFKEKLERNSVCLENIILKDVISINGTVKAKNIAFQKRITVRITFDCWKSFHDHEASYVKSVYGHDEYDTFQFNITVPESFDAVSQKAELCVRYETNNTEYWDNNEGENYVISSNIFSDTVLSDTKFTPTCPNTYCELPSPQFNTWSEWENKGPFY